MCEYCLKYPPSCNMYTVISRGVKSKNFSFDSQRLVPKIVRESDSQLPSPKNRQNPHSTSLSRKILRSTPNFQLSVPKIVRELNSQLSTPTRLPIAGYKLATFIQGCRVKRFFVRLPTPSSQNC